MTGTFAETVAPSPRARWSALPRDPRLVLAVVCVLHALSPWFLVGFDVRYAWDEAVYLSQFSGDSPPVIFSAPRARGTAMLVAPVTVFTDSVVLVRLYLVALSGAGCTSRTGLGSGCVRAI